MSIKLLMLGYISVVAFVFIMFYWLYQAFKIAASTQSPIVDNDPRLTTLRYSPLSMMIGAYRSATSRGLSIMLISRSEYQLVFPIWDQSSCMNSQKPIFQVPPLILFVCFCIVCTVFNMNFTTSTSYAKHGRICIGQSRTLFIFNIHKNHDT